MKIGEIIEVEGVKYIAQEEILACKGCHFEYSNNAKCYKEFGCKTEEDVILVEIPVELLEKIEQLEKQIELMKNCENCGNANFGENCKKCVNFSRWEMFK